VAPMLKPQIPSFTSDGSDDSRFAMCAAKHPVPQCHLCHLLMCPLPVSFPKIVIRHFSGFRIQRNSNTTMFQSSEYLEQFFDKFHERNSHEVQGNPPKAATGWVAAVEHIHLIYMNINFKVNKLCCSENSCHALLLSKISYTILIFGTPLQMLILLHDGSGIRQGVCVSISIDACFKYTAWMLKIWQRKRIQELGPAC